MTPGAPFTPQTPGTAMDHFQADWHTPEIEVRIRETHDDADLIHQTGVIRGVTVSTVNLEMLKFQNGIFQLMNWANPTSLLSIK